MQQITESAQQDFLGGDNADNDDWVELSHCDERWSFNNDELSIWDREDGVFTFHCFHRITSPSVDQIKEFIDKSRPSLSRSKI